MKPASLDVYEIVPLQRSLFDEPVEGRDLEVEPKTASCRSKAPVRKSGEVQFMVEMPADRYLSPNE